MKILDDLLSVLDSDTAVREVCAGTFQTAVLTRHCGLAATLLGGLDCESGQGVGDAGRLTRKKAREVAEMAFSSSLLEASIGMAAINSLLEVDEARCSRVNARDILLQRGRGKKVAVVGHFPFVDRLRQEAAELWVVERRPREGDFIESEADRLIPQADVVAITGTTFTNHTIERLLTLCRSDAYVIVLGPTVPLSPVLFRYGVSAVAGARVHDPGAVMRAVSQGATFRQLTGVELLTMEREG